MQPTCFVVYILPLTTQLGRVWFSVCVILVGTHTPQSQHDSGNHQLHINNLCMFSTHQVICDDDEEEDDEYVGPGLSVQTASAGVPAASLTPKLKSMQSYTFGDNTVIPVSDARRNPSPCVYNCDRMTRVKPMQFRCCINSDITCLYCISTRMPSDIDTQLESDGESKTCNGKCYLPGH